MLAYCRAEMCDARASDFGRGGQLRWRDREQSFNRLSGHLGDLDLSDDDEALDPGMANRNGVVHGNILAIPPTASLPRAVDLTLKAGFWP
jgi:hypothetical protein